MFGLWLLYWTAQVQHVEDAKHSCSIPDLSTFLTYYSLVSFQIVAMWQLGVMENKYNVESDTLGFNTSSTSFPSLDELFSCFLRALLREINVSRTMNIISI